MALTLARSTCDALRWTRHKISFISSRLSHLSCPLHKIAFLEFEKMSHQDFNFISRFEALTEVARLLSRWECRFPSSLRVEFPRCRICRWLKSISWRKSRFGDVSPVVLEQTVVEKTPMCKVKHASFDQLSWIWNEWNFASPDLIYISHHPSLDVSVVFGSQSSPELFFHFLHHSSTSTCGFEAQRTHNGA